MEWLNAASYRAAIDAVALRPGERLLELGFGTGAFLELVCKTVPGVSIAGVDPSATMVQVAQRRLRKLPGVDLSQIRIGFERPLTWPERSFEAVVAIHGFQFWEKPEASLAEICRVLKPGGRLALVLRAHLRPPQWLPNPMSRSGNEAGANLLMEQAGFHATEVAPSGSSRILVGSLPDNRTERL